MAKTKPYALKSREFGRGKPHIKRFATLAEASKAVREQWQGADFMDGPSGFHTDYCTFELIGFVLRDIGKMKPTSDGWREFVFDEESPAG